MFKVCRIDIVVDGKVVGKTYRKLSPTSLLTMGNGSQVGSWPGLPVGVVCNGHLSEPTPGVFRFEFDTKTTN